MSSRNQGYRGGGGPRQQQWNRGGGGDRQQRSQSYNNQYGQNDNSQNSFYHEQEESQSWPRQQQLPNNQGSSWNRNHGDDRHYQRTNSSSSPQQRSQQGWQKSETHRQQPGSTCSQRQSQKQQQQQQKPPQQPREFKPPPPRPNAWGEPPSGKQEQPTQIAPQQKNPPPQQQPQHAPARTTNTRPEAAPSKGIVTSEATTTTTVSGATGAWTTKFTSKKANAGAGKGPPPRGQKVAPVSILKPDAAAAAPPAKKPKNKHTAANKKKDSGSSSGNNNNNKIHGKKPKLSNISMGDLVPNIKKIIPKDKKKKNANQSTPAQTPLQLQTRTQTQPMNTTTTATSDFPALPTTSNWPSLAASKPATKPATVPAAAPVVNKASPPKQTKSNNNNNRSKKRKNQSQQAQDAKKGGTKGKNSGSNATSSPLIKPDENHLAAAFLLPPSKLDPVHMQAQFRITGGAASGDLGGAEHDLMRMVMQGGTLMTKGRQRIKPRKKRFTALKRKILLERLRVWKELHPGEDGEKSNKSGEVSCTIGVYGFASLEEVEDDDEFQELLDNLKDMADKMGNVRYVFIPRESIEENSGDDSIREHPAYVHFSTTAEAMATRGVWDGLVIGGQPLKVRSLAIDNTSIEAMDEGAETEEVWQRACLEVERGVNDETMDDVDSSTCRILLKDVLTEDDLEDDECFAESIQDIKQMVEKFGIVKDVQAKKQEGSTDVIIVYKGGHGVAQPALEELQKLTLGGSQLAVEILPSQTAESRPTKLLLENILTEDDLEDQECLEESLSDVRALLEKYGSVSSLEVTETQIVIAFDGLAAEDLSGIAERLNGTCLGGQMVKASAILEIPAASDELCVRLRNLLTQDDLDDDECLEESLEDVRELARQYGNVQDIEVERGDDVSTSAIKVNYSTRTEVESAMKQFQGMVVGGETVSAFMGLHSTNTISDPADPFISDADGKTPAGQDGEPKPMFSGDKRIPERFAECKRVPKIPNKGTPRNYAILTNNDTVKPLLVEMLNELMRLQLRALHDKNAKNAKARRRVVIGLREVARGIRANKVKMVVMANNLDEYGAIDDKLQEILDLSAEKEIPVLFELSKRVLGKALGKKIKVSVAAVQATDGAHQQFVKLSSLAPHLEKPPPAE